jgi:hypothetical protein
MVGFEHRALPDEEADMPSRAVMIFRLTAFSAVFALAACGQGSEANNSFAVNDADPALTAALEDPILTDPGLSQQANRHNVRPPELPTRAEYPAAGSPPAVRLASGAAPQPPGQGPAPRTGAPLAGGGCAARPGQPAPTFSYGMEWSRRLPAAFPPYPGGRVTEAAGQDSGPCRVRVVTFRTRDPYQRVIDWYERHAVEAGFSAEQQARGRDHVLGGVHPASNGAYFLIVTPVEDGSEVALIVNNGR